MRRDDERALYGLADDDDRPDPADARTAAEFVALLGALIEHSGLSLAEIEELAGSKGYVLPEQIIATALSHDALPPEELVVALVRSIGINDREVKYWVEVLWRLEARPTYNPDQPNQEHARQAPRDIDQIYGPKQEAGPSRPYVVPAPNDIAQVPDAHGLYEEPYAVPMFLERGHVPDIEERRGLPKSNRAAHAPAASEVGVDHPHSDEVDEYDEPHVKAEPVSSAPPHDHSRRPMARADQADAQLEPRNARVVRPERPRILDTTTGSIRRVRQKARWPVPVGVGLSAVLAVSVGAWIAFGDGDTPRDFVGAPGTTHNETGTSSRTTDATATNGASPTGPAAVIPGTSGNLPGTQPTTHGPKPTPTQPGSYNTQLKGSGSTSCSNDNGQWRVRVLVSVTVTDPPPGLVPQGQVGISGSMQGFSLSGGGTSYSGSASVLVGPSSSPSVGTVQWLVTMSTPDGWTVREESFEGYSCA